LGQWYRKELGDSGFKSLKIAAKNSINFVLRKYAVVFRLQLERVPLV
jgi:hypothetical protein